MILLKKILAVSSLFCFLFITPVLAQSLDTEPYGYDEPDGVYIDQEFEEFMKEADNLSNDPTEQEVDESFKQKTKSFKILASDLNPMNITGPEDIFSSVINILMAFIGSLALVFYIYAGLLWMSAGGNSEKVTKAKDMLVWTTLGIIAMTSSYLIVRVVLERVG